MSPLFVPPYPSRFRATRAGVLALFCAGVLLQSITTASAANVTWSSAGNATAGGTGNWSGGSTWWNGSSAVTWTAGDNATFSAAGNTTVNSTITVGSLTFTSATVNSSILAGAGTFTLNGGITVTNTGNTTAITDTITSNITLGANQTWTVNNGGSVGTANLTVSGIISGANIGLIKAGNGTLTLSGANTYSGGTTINGGTLQLNAAVGSGSAYTGNSTYNINNASTLRLSTGAASNPGITGSIFNFDSNGGGTLDLGAGLNGLLQGAGIFINTNGGAQSQLSGSGNLNDQNGNQQVVFNIASGSNATADFLVTGGSMYRNAITKNGTGKLLFQNMTVGGLTLWDIRINQGTMEFGGNSTLTNLNAGSVFANNATLSWNSTGSSTISNNITGTGVIIKSNTSTLTLSGNNTYTGATTINGGLINIGHANALGASGNITFGGGGLQYGSNITTDISSRIKNSTGAVLIDTNSNNVTFASAVDSTNTFGLTKNGTGTLTLSGNNSYSGVTTISAGTLSVSTLANGGSNSGIGASSNAASNLVIAGGTLSYSGGNVTIDRGFTISNATTGSIEVSNAAATLTIAGNSATTTGNLTKIGSGTLTLSGNNTYSGVTTVSAGTLKAGSTNALSSNSTFTVGSGATLDLVGFNSTILNLSAGTGTITDSSATGSGAILKISTGLSAAPTNLFTGSLGLNILGSNIPSNASNTYSGGTIFGASTSTSNRWIGSGTIGTMTAGNVTSGFFGTGTITLGLAATDRGQFYLNGATTINNAIVVNTNLGDGTIGTIRLESGGTLTLNGAVNANLADFMINANNAGTSTAIVNGAISGNSGLYVNTVNGILNVTLNATANANTYAGNTTINTANATLTLGKSNQIANGVGKGNLINNGTFSMGSFSDTINGLSGNGTIDGVSGTPTLTVGDNDATSTFSGVIKNTAGSLALTKTGNGTLTLSGISTYTGATTISAGTLSLTGNLSGGTAISVGGAGVFTQGSASIISGTSSFTQNSSGTSTLAGSNTYNGVTTVSAGTLQMGHANGLGSGGNITFGGGVLQYGSSITTDISSRIKNSGSAIAIDTNSNNVTFASAVDTTNTLGLTKNGIGTLTLSGNNTYTGATTINTGTLQIGAGGTTGSLSSSSSITNNATLVFNRTDSLTQGNTIAGTGALIQAGSGTVTLSGNSTYSGATTINAGTLAVTGNISSSATTVSTGGTLNGSGRVGATTVTGTMAGTLSAGAITVNAGGILSPNTTGTAGTLSSTSLTINGGGYNWTIANGSNYATAGTDYDQIASTGALTLNNTAASPFVVYVYGNATGWNGLVNKTWNIMTAGSITGFTAGNFSLNFDNFGITSENRAGTWTFNATSGTNLTLSYTLQTPNYYWDGASGNWSDSYVANTRGFNPGTPENDKNIFLTGSGGTVTNNVANGTLTSLGFITFNSTAGAYTLAANAGSSGASGGTALSVLGDIINNSSNATGQTINLALALTGSSTGVVNAAAGNITIGGVISGTGALKKTGGNTLVLSASNTYSGGTTLSNGTLAINNATAIGTGALTIVSGTLGNTSGANITLTNNNAQNWNGDFTFNSTKDLNMGTGAVTMNASRTVTVSGGNFTVGGIISGSGYGLTKNGSGTMILSGVNTYTGATTINAGTLTANGGSAIADASAVSVGSGAVFNLGASETVGSIAGAGNITLGSYTLTAGGDNSSTTASGVISGTGSLTKNGSGALTLSGANTYNGTTTVSAGTLKAGSTNALSSNSTFTVGSGATLDLVGFNSTILNLSAGTGTITDSSATGSGAILKISTGLSAAPTNLFTGSLGLNILGSNIPSNASNTYSGGTIFGASTSTSNRWIGSGTIGTMTAGNVTSGFFGTGTITLGLAATDRGQFYLNGATTINNAIVVNTNLGDGTIGTIRLESGGTLTLNGAVNANLADFMINANNAGTSTAIVNGAISGNSGLYVYTVNGILNVTLNSTASANTYAGNTTINGTSSTLTLGKSDQIANGVGKGNLIIYSGTFAMGGFSDTINGLEGNGTIDGVSGTPTLTVGDNNTTSTFSGVMKNTAGTLALTKNGTGTLTLSGNSTHTGATTVNAGTLTVSGNISSSASTIASGATLDGTGRVGAVTVSGTLAGTLTTANITVSSGGLLSPGGNGSVGTITAGNITLSAGSGYAWTLANATGAAGTGFDQVTGTGALTMSNTAASPFTVYVFGNATNWSGNTTSWNIISAASQTGFSTGNFAVNVASFGVASANRTGTWSFTNPSGGNITLNYTVAGADSIWAGGTGNFSSNFTAALTANATNIQFTGAGGIATNNISNGTITSVNFITFNSSASAYTLAANAGSSGNGTALTVLGDIINNSANATGQTISMALALGSTSTGIINTAAGNITISGNLSGTGTLTKSGNYALTLSGASKSNTGDVTINAGNVTVSGGALTTNITVNSGATLISGANFALAQASGKSLTINGGTLSISNTYVEPGGYVIMNNATINGNSSGQILATSGWIGNGNNTINHQVSMENNKGWTSGLFDIQSGTTTINSVVYNYLNRTQGITKNGTGALVLNGANTYNGSSTLNAGTLVLNNNTALGLQSLTIVSGTLDNTSGSAKTLTNNNTQNWNGDFTYLGTNGSLDMGTGAVSMNASRVVTVSNSTLTIGGIISGSTFGLTKNGTGTMILTGANTYNGTTTINAGTLQIGNGGATGSLASTAIVNNANLVYNSSGSYSLPSGGINGTGNITVSAGNPVTFAGNITLSGSHTYNATRYDLSNNATLSGSSITLNNKITEATPGKKLELNTSSTNGPITLNNINIGQSGVYYGLNSFTANAGTGNLSLSGSSTIWRANTTNITGALNISANISGVETEGSGAGATFNLTATAASSVTGNITLSTNSSNTFTSNPSVNMTVSGILAGSNASITKNGTGTLTLSGANTYNGTTTLNAGQINVNHATALGNGTLTIAGGTIDNTSGSAITLTNNNAQNWNGDFTLNGTKDLNMGTGAVTMNASRIVTVNAGNFTVGGNITGSTFGLTKNGSGTMILSGANTYNGTTTINAGTLTANGGSAIADTSAVTIASGAAFNIGANETVASIAGAGNIALGSYTLTAGGDNSSTTVSGVISGTGNLIKSGTGNLTLTGISTFNGNTTISGGKLVVNGSAANSAVTIGSGATLAGSGTVGAVTVQSGGFIAPGNSPGNINVSTLTLAGGGGYNLELANVSGTAGLDWDFITVGSGSGAATITANATNQFTIYISGNPVGWNTNTSTSWNIIDWGTVTNFDASFFSVNTTAFTGTAPVGTWAVSNTGGYLSLDYMAGDPTWNGGTGNWGDAYVSTVTGFSSSLTGGNKSVFFTGAAGGTTTNNRTLADVPSVASITFNSTAGAYTLAANSGSAGYNATSALELNGNIVNNSNATQTINLALTSNTTRVYDAAAGNITIGGAISGTGGLTKNGSNTLALSEVNTYTGATTINAGTLTISGAGQLGSGSYSGNISNAGVFNYASSANQTLSGIISGTGALTKDGASTLTLTGVNTYTGATTITAGTLTIGGAGQLGSGNYSGNIVNNGLLAYNSSANQTLGGTISGTGDLVKNGNSTLTLSHANTYNGSTTINAGTLSVSAANALGATTQVIINEGGSMLVAASDAINDAAAISMGNNSKLVFSGTVGEVVGEFSLSQNATAILDMGSGATWISFWKFTSALSEDTQLWIYNYTVGSDHVYIRDDTNHNVVASLPNVTFYSDFGTTSLGSGFFSAPELHSHIVPEPETYATAALLLIGLGIYAYRRRQAKASQVS